MNKMVTRAGEVDPLVGTLGKIGLRPAIGSRGQETVFLADPIAMPHHRHHSHSTSTTTWFCFCFYFAQRGPKLHILLRLARSIAAASHLPGSQDVCAELRHTKNEPTGLCCGVPHPFAYIRVRAAGVQYLVGQVIRFPSRPVRHVRAAGSQEDKRGFTPMAGINSFAGPKNGGSLRENATLQGSRGP